MFLFFRASSLYVFICPCFYIKKVQSRILTVITLSTLGIQCEVLRDAYSCLAQSFPPDITGLAAHKVMNPAQKFPPDSSRLDNPAQKFPPDLLVRMPLYKEITNHVTNCTLS